MALTVSDHALARPAAPDGLSRWLAEEAPGAIAGSGGHDATFTVACALWRMLDDEAAVWSRLQEYNRSRCDPPWSERELRHKIADSDKATAGDPKRGACSRKARCSRPGEILAALAAPPRRYSFPGRPALPRPTPRLEPTTREKHDNPAAPEVPAVPKLVADMDIRKCGSCKVRRWWERWCDRHPRARQYRPAPALPCIRPEVTP